MGGGMKHGAFTLLLPDRGLDEVFQLLSQLGYDGVELRVKEDYHVAPDQLLSRAGYLPVRDRPRDAAARVRGGGSVGRKGSHGVVGTSPRRHAILLESAGRLTATQGISPTRI
jgi:hypothetical protein